MSEDDFSKPQYKAWEEDMFVINYGKPTLVFDMEKHIVENNLQDTPVDWHRKEYNIKSALGIPIIAANQNYGSLILQYTDNVVEFSEQELEFINIIANQAGIALHQAKLFEITKLQAERERISKNMVEILRSTLDKNIIKHLFVKNIGELLKADRVFFSEFDPKSGIYITVDKNSEYLSSPKEKSFVGFDWSDESVSEHIQPLLQRRELNIPSWEEYVKDCQKGPEFIALFEDASVKSSYNFPVLYEDKMMGFFCIEFTQEVHKLSNEDINRIRNICTQTAIALYHSGLLLKAQEATRSKAEFISNITNEFKVPLNFIIEFSELLAKTELERSKQIAYLNGISANGRQLLELTDDIIDISEIESDMFKLHYEHVDSEKLIREVLNSFHFMLLEKNINIETVLVSANVNADRKMLTKIIHILLTNAIKFSQKNGKIIITSALDDDRLFLSIEDTGIGTYADEHDLIFDELKQVDTAYTRRQQGSGLGLSIAKKLVELHNGNIHVESAGMKGSRFWLTLPRAYKVD
jgi:signal transduction histidine kinase